MAYLLSLLVGIVYALVEVRSPAPPLVALIGRFGIVSGEMGTTMVKQHYVRFVAVAGSSPSDFPR